MAMVVVCWSILQTIYTTVVTMLSLSYTTGICGWQRTPLQQNTITTEHHYDISRYMNSFYGVNGACINECQNSHSSRLYNSTANINHNTTVPVIEGNSGLLRYKQFGNIILWHSILHTSEKFLAVDSKAVTVQSFLLLWKEMPSFIYAIISKIIDETIKRRTGTSFFHIMLALFWA